MGSVVGSRSRESNQRRTDDAFIIADRRPPSTATPLRSPSPWICCDPSLDTSHNLVKFTEESSGERACSRGMMEELQRALMDRGLAVSNSPEKGRCHLANRDFYPGDIITSQEPYVSVSSNTMATTRCEVCFACASLKKCSACRAVWYCGSACQKSDWRLHRVECQALAKLEEKKKALTPSIRLMVKLYLKSNLQIEKVLPTTVTDNYPLLGAMVSHMSEINEKQLILYAQMANLVSVVLQWPDLNFKDIGENFSKLACNAHSICDYELRPLGTGLYPVISIINHSCLPNSVLVFEGREAVVRAVQHIPKAI